MTYRQPVVYGQIFLSITILRMRIAPPRIYQERKTWKCKGHPPNRQNLDIIAITNNNSDGRRKGAFTAVVPTGA